MSRKIHIFYTKTRFYTELLATQCYTLAQFCVAKGIILKTNANAINSFQYNTYMASVFADKVLVLLVIITQRHSRDIGFI